MTDPSAWIEDNEGSWEVDTQIGLKFSRPYEECPHCGQYGYQQVREARWTTWWIFKTGIDGGLRYAHCDECGYETEKEETDEW